MQTIRPTRHPALGYMEHGGIWRIVTTEDGAAVGPQYATKGELLADLDRYATEYMGTPDPRDARIAELEGALRMMVEQYGCVTRVTRGTDPEKNGDPYVAQARAALGKAVPHG